ncbi:hypothetical protein HYH03_006817 [Edaphochlamys debaryana]|uniref:Transmembrane protein 45B n=1 Tax=Edaphochlamys debaryana TaxID=47281 RepID=A0A835Y3D0_9CHLO|nr:hypothetical protein HYH03_006817 [Edaphochlamys debaryana]|eukprot:KAG2495211.1 hypothetical protein HYH03_006817 [Edaphochlamys debaryana]
MSGGMASGGMGGNSDAGMGSPSPAMSGGPSMGGGAAMGDGHSSMGAMEGMMDCFGAPMKEVQGNWQGHVFPGTIFIIWGLHWFISASWRHLCAVRNKEKYRTRSTEGLLPMIPGLAGFNRYPVESVLKAVGGLLLFVLQITYGGYKFLYCPDGARMGRITTQHLNSWSHASMNLGYALSGIVELAGIYLHFPEGTNQAFLAGGFAVEALLFALHEKNRMLDRTIHWLLAQPIWYAAFFSFLETCFPEQFLLTAGRAFGQILQGTWFIQSASVLFGGHIWWSDDFQGIQDEAPSMWIAMVFVYHALILSAVLVFIYGGLELLARRLAPGPFQDDLADPSGLRNGGYETSRLLSGDEEGEGLKSVPLSVIGRGGAFGEAGRRH